MLLSRAPQVSFTLYDAVAMPLQCNHPVHGTRIRTRLIVLFHTSTSGPSQSLLNVRVNDKEKANRSFLFTWK